MSLLASVSVRVPATTSNLGPGFDSLGMALTLYNRLTLEVHSGGGPVRVEVSGEGRGRLPETASNLMVRSARRLLGPRLGGRLVFKADNGIPIARGRGSSAAAILAGLAAANALRKSRRLGLDELEQLATRIEGHVGNIGPALRGGLVATTFRGGVRSVKAATRPDLAAVLCIPDFELSTRRARAALPAKVPLADAADNSARTFLLALALAKGDWAALAEAMQDRLHQPYRAPLVPGLGAVIRSAQKERLCGAALSGAGPTVLALGPKGAAARAGERMKRAFARRGIRSRVLILRPDLQGLITGRRALR